MTNLIEWFENRWDCIDNDIDIPLVDALVCYATIPLIMLGIVALIVTVPIWGIPYVVYRVCFAERRENGNQ